MKKIILAIIVAVLIASSFLFHTCGKEIVVIYTSAEDYAIEYMQNKLDEKFPDYNIIIDYVSTNDIATKVIISKEKSECDIIFEQEYGYVSKMVNEGALANLKGMYDLSIYTDEALPDNIKDYIVPCLKIGGGVIANTTVLEEKGIPEPTCYEDLLDPKFKNLLSMPSPKSSSTGYMFLLSMVNQRGEDGAFSYFDEFTKNVLQYTSSGSGPVNALVNREAAIGFGMIPQAVDKINNGNNELKILFFDEGSPFSLYANAIVKGKEKRPAVKEVMDYLYSELGEEICQKYYPESIYKDKIYNVENYPNNIIYSKMDNNTIENMEYLKSKWSH